MPKTKKQDTEEQVVEDTMEEQTEESKEDEKVVTITLPDKVSFLGPIWTIADLQLAHQMLIKQFNVYRREIQTGIKEEKR